jgi:signal transduction histidine kinase
MDRASSIAKRLLGSHLAVALVAGGLFGIGAGLGIPAGWAAAGAAVVAAAVGAMLAVRSARWVARPLHDLAGTASAVLAPGPGDLPTALLGEPGLTAPQAATAGTPQAGATPGGGAGASPLEGGVPDITEAGPEEVRKLAATLDQVICGVAARLSQLNREAGLREQILSSMSEGVVLADATGRLLYANPAAHELLAGATILPAQLRAEGPVELTLRHPRRRELKATCLRLEDGRRLVAMQDVTEAKRIEAMRRDFVADASHELKTPVASILAVAETLETAVEDDPSAVPIFMSTLLSETRRMSALVQDLLDLARLEGRPTDRRLVSLTQVVARETSRVRQDAEGKGLVLKEEIEESVNVAGNAEDLSLALRNLLDNALRYTLNGQVAVKLYRQGTQAVIEVDDTGPGIPGKDLGRIFERFYRVDRARSRETGGTGLGLAIVRHVVEQHAGQVEVESELGRGSRFVVTLPALLPPPRP